MGDRSDENDDLPNLGEDEAGESTVAMLSPFDINASSPSSLPPLPISSPPPGFPAPALVPRDPRDPRDLSDPLAGPPGHTPPSGGTILAPTQVPNARLPEDEEGPPSTGTLAMFAPARPSTALRAASVLGTPAPMPARQGINAPRPMAAPQASPLPTPPRSASASAPSPAPSPFGDEGEVTQDARTANIPLEAFGSDPDLASAARARQPDARARHASPLATTGFAGGPPSSPLDPRRAPPGSAGARSSGALPAAPPALSAQPRPSAPIPAAGQPPHPAPALDLDLPPESAVPSRRSDTGSIPLLPVSPGGLPIMSGGDGENETRTLAIPHELLDLARTPGLFPSPAGSPLGDGRTPFSGVSPAPEVTLREPVPHPPSSKQDAHVVVAEDAMGDDATVALLPSENAANAANANSGIARALAETLGQFGPGESAEPAFPPPGPPIAGYAGAGAGMPTGRTRHSPTALGLAPPAAGGWAPQGPMHTDGPFGGPTSVGPSGPMSAGPMSGPTAGPSHVADAFRGGPMNGPALGAGPMSGGPMSGPAPYGAPGAPGLPGPYHVGPGVSGQPLGGYPAHPAHPAPPHANPYPTGPQPAPSAPRPNGQILLLVVVGIVCLAIFVTGIVLFATTRF